MTSDFSYLWISFSMDWNSDFFSFFFRLVATQKWKAQSSLLFNTIFWKKRDSCLFQRHLHKSESNKLDQNLNFVCQFHYIQDNTCNIRGYGCFCTILHMTFKHGKSVVFWDCNAPTDKAIELMYSPWFWSFCLIGLKFFSTFNLHGAVNYFIRSKGTKIFNFNDVNLQEKIYRNKFIKIIAILSNIYTIKIFETFKWTFVLSSPLFLIHQKNNVTMLTIIDLFLTW